MKEFLTISEFATKAGVSRQAVYKQLTTKLTNYVKVDNGKKLINKEALELFVNSVDTPGDNIRAQNDNLLSSVIETLQQQLKAKDEQIEALQEQNKRLAELMTETLQISKAAQTLQAGQMMLDAPKEKKKWSLFKKG